MADLGLPSAPYVLAKLDIQIAEQDLAIEGRELRLAEITDEEERVGVDITGLETKIAEADEKLATMVDGTLDSRRLHYRAGEFSLAIKNRKLRLLELDEERRVVHRDIEASRTHIASLQAEVKQQTARLAKESGK